MDWTAWNNRYDDPDEWLVSRLRIVHQQLAEALEAGPRGPLRLISVCAGQGRDVIGVLAGHPRRDDVSALLAELDQATVDTGRDLAAAAGLTRVRFVVGDAARTDLYRDSTPADIVLVCGVFGNIITAADVHRAIGVLPQLCAPGAAVIWTRGRRGLTNPVPDIQDWFAEAGFTERDFHASSAGFTVGRHDYTGPTQRRTAGQSMFDFIGYDELHGIAGIWSR